MEVNVKVTVEVGPQTLALLSGGLLANGSKGVEKTAVKETTASDEAAKPETTKADEKATTRTRRTKEQIAAEEEKTANGFADMDDDAKLEAIKTEVTKHTKKGKSADIKFLLSNFDAGRASELAPEDYDAFYDAIGRYGKGESVEKIFPGDEDLN